MVYSTNQVIRVDGNKALLLAEKLEALAKEIRQVFTEYLEKPPTFDEKAINNLKWTAYPSGPGEWTFAQNRDGSAIAELVPLLEFLKTSKGVDIGVWTYKLGKNPKFLQRFPKEVL